MARPRPHSLNTSPPRTRGGLATPLALRARGALPSFSVRLRRRAGGQASRAGRLSGGDRARWRRCGGGAPDARYRARAGTAASAATTRAPARPSP